MTRRAASFTSPISGETPIVQRARSGRALVELGGVRTCLPVPLRKDDDAARLITVYRQEVRPFSDKQIALLQNFAAQAVIAMENARLIDRDSARRWSSRPRPPRCCRSSTRSPGDLAPVFDAMLEKAMRLCEAAFGSLVDL